MFGCNFKSHQIGRVIRYNTEYCDDKRYASFGNLLRTGNLYSEDFCYHIVPEKLDPLRPPQAAAAVSGCYQYTRFCAENKRKRKKSAPGWTRPRARERAKSYF